MNARWSSRRSPSVVVALLLGVVAAGCGSDGPPRTDSSFGAGPPTTPATTPATTPTAGSGDEITAAPPSTDSTGSDTASVDRNGADDRCCGTAAHTGRVALRDRQLRPAGPADHTSRRCNGLRRRATRQGGGRHRPVERRRARHQRPHRRERRAGPARAGVPPDGRPGLRRLHVDVRRHGRRRVRRRSDHGVFDPSSRREVLTVDQPYSNHNGGQLAFGPDQLLYIGLGDGGSGGDPGRRALDLGTLLGKILRIDPVADGDQPYTVPADNPFVDTDGADPEIWAYGLRNPWRFSFDAPTGDLWIADVGQGDWEEVNRARATADRMDAARGANFGWSAMEGFERFNVDQSSDGALAAVLRLRPRRRSVLGERRRGRARPNRSPTCRAGTCSATTAPARSGPSTRPCPPANPASSRSPGSTDSPRSPRAPTVTSTPSPMPAPSPA